MIKVVPFIYEDLDDLFAHTYLLIDEDNCCVVIDPAKDYPGLVNYIKKNNLKLNAILLTHGHFDHIRGVDCLYNEFHCPVYIGYEDLEKLRDYYGNCSFLLNQNTVIKAPAEIIGDKQVLKLLKEDIQVIYTRYELK